MKIWPPILLVLVFPLVQELRRPSDVLSTCPPNRLRVSQNGLLTCDRGRPLKNLERLAVGLPVDVHDLGREEWRQLLGKRAAGRVAEALRRDGRLCRWSLHELTGTLSREQVENLPPGLHCQKGAKRDQAGAWKNGTPGPFQGTPR